MARMGMLRRALLWAGPLGLMVPMANPSELGMAQDTTSSAHPQTEASEKKKKKPRADEGEVPNPRPGGTVSRTGDTTSGTATGSASNSANNSSSGSSSSTATGSASGTASGAGDAGTGNKTSSKRHHKKSEDKSRHVEGSSSKTEKL